MDTKVVLKYIDGGVRMKGIPQGRYTKEFREEAVKLVTQGDLTIPEAAKRLSLPLSTLANWLRASKSGKLAEIGRGQRPLTEIEMELAGTKRELAEVWIPKPDGRQRPIGIAALEDKIVQQAAVWVLSHIYEEDFLGFSYGFRPERSQHNALDAIWVGITQRKVSWVLDADIKSFFDTINHAWLMKFLERRIGDPRMLRLIRTSLRH